MKKSIVTCLALATAWLSVSSCVKQDYDTSGCAQELRLEFSWVGAAEPRTETEQIGVSIYDANQKETQITSTPAGRYITLDPGSYRFVGAESSENVTIQGRTVTVMTGSDGMALDAEPFSAGITDGTVLDNTTGQVVTIPMRQQSRELIVRVNFTGDFMNLVNTVTGDIAGVAISRDIENAFPPVASADRPVAITDGSISYTFTREAPETPGAVDEWFSGTRRLIGIDGGDAQVLTLTVLFDGGTIDEVPFDITQMLAGFHSLNLPEAWIIEITFEVSLDLDLVIINWFAGTESNLIAE